MNQSKQLFDIFASEFSEYFIGTVDENVKESFLFIKNFWENELKNQDHTLISTVDNFNEHHQTINLQFLKNKLWNNYTHQLSTQNYLVLPQKINNLFQFSLCQQDKNLQRSDPQLWWEKYGPKLFHPAKYLQTYFRGEYSDTEGLITWKLINNDNSIQWVALHYYEGSCAGCHNTKNYDEFNPETILRHCYIFNSIIGLSQFVSEWTLKKSEINAYW